MMEQKESSHHSAQDDVEALYEAVREECPPAVWERGQKLSRNATLLAQRRGPDEIEAQVSGSGGVSTPTMLLSPKQCDWDCPCPSQDGACLHVAAAVILLRDRLRSNAALKSAKLPGRLRYELQRSEGGLALQISLTRQGKTEPLTTSLGHLLKRLGSDAVAIDSHDRAIDELLRWRRQGPILQPLMARLLKALSEKEGVLFDGEPISIGKPEATTVIRVTDHEGGFRLFADVRKGISEVFDNGAARRDDEIFAIDEPDLSSADLEALRVGKVYNDSEVHALVSRILPELKKRAPVEVSTRKLPKLQKITPRVLFETRQEAGEMVLRASIVYGDPPCARVEGTKVVHLGGALPARDEPTERALATRLRDELNLLPDVDCRVGGELAVQLVEKVRRFGSDADFSGLERLFIAKALEPSLEERDEGTTLTFRTMHEGREERVSAEAVVAAWQRGGTLVALDTGGWAPLPSGFLAKHGHLVEDLIAAKMERETFPKSAGADVARLYEALDAPPPADLLTLKRLADSFEGIEATELPSDLHGDLRAYQREGVDWLGFLSRSGLGGLLADDMGLGKTLQAICTIRSPTLVVCPASVVHAWHEEISRFRPGLRVIRYHGRDRALDPEADVTLTTYAILRQDIDALESVQWDTVVVDEAQNIKNPVSQSARATYRLRARFRIALTGTPVENRLEDLWSQMNFLNPGLLGGLDDFRDRYARPISEGDRDAVQRLQRRIRPFLLRRLKSEVAKELPPRTDVLLRCELDDEERAAYDAVRAATRAEVVEQLAKGGSVLAALEALLRLRQAACHTGLLPGREADSSSKVRLLMDALEETAAEGHRSLVFSQWTSFLDRIEPHLKAAHLPFLRLDGSTKDREGVVRRFQSRVGPPVMLISLKAGGTGLTLTRADHVFLMDPWWNPAVEDQAADRIHRIGQEQPVVVHRVVAAETVEERLLELQRRKRDLAAAALGGEGGGAGLTRDDLLELLSD